MQRRDPKARLASQLSSFAAVAVFHGAREAPFVIRKSFTESDLYREHLQRLSTCHYEEILTELKRLTRPSARARRRGDRTRPPVLGQRSCFAWDFAPRADYATKFVNTTKQRLVSSDPNFRVQGQRAVSILTRLIFEAEWPRSGRPPAKTSLPLAVREERQQLLSEIKQLFLEFPRSQCGAELHAAVERVVARELPGRVGMLKKKKNIDRLLKRKILRPVDITNQIVAWKHNVRPAAVQRITAQPPEIKHG